MATETGIITSILKKWESGRRFALMQHESPQGLVTAKISGYMGELVEGDCFYAVGEWDLKNTFRGRPDPIFKAQKVRPEYPRTADGVLAYLTRMFRDAGIAYSEERMKALVGRFGGGTLKKIAADHSLLVGVGANPVSDGPALVQEFFRRTATRQASNLMSSAGVEPVAVSRFLESFKERSMSVIERNPYSLALVDDVGFDNAERVGKLYKISSSDTRRITSLCEEVICKMASEGSTGYPVTALLENIPSRYEINPQAVISFSSAINGLFGTRGAAFASGPSGPIAGVKKYMVAEENISNAVAGMILQGRRNDNDGAQKVIERVLAKTKFDDVQKAAVRGAATEALFILTGGPGTGKSTVLRALADCLDEIETGPVYYVSQSAKAADRMTETTGRYADTIHFLLESRLNEKGESEFRRNRKNPLPRGSVVVVDEASFTDVVVMDAVLSALPQDGRLILVGDKDQLPSVEPGAVLKDLLELEYNDVPLIPSVELQKTYRSKGKLATDAVEIKFGRMPVLDTRRDQGTTLFEVGPREVTGTIANLVAELSSKTLLMPGEKTPVQLKLTEDLVVLCPQNPGVGGAWEINRKLQALYNPKGKAIPGIRGMPGKQPVPKVGDRVMATKNHRKQKVRNGDIGTVLGWREEKVGDTHKVWVDVQFDNGRKMEYPASWWKDLILAYAISVHRSQGSQYRAVILTMSMAHERMLERAMLYTGWTRAQNFVAVVGQKEAMKVCLGRVNSLTRRTRLKDAFGSTWLRKMYKTVVSRGAQPRIKKAAPRTASPEAAPRSETRKNANERPAAKSAFDFFGGMSAGRGPANKRQKLPDGASKSSSCASSPFSFHPQKAAASHSANGQPKAQAAENDSPLEKNFDPFSGLFGR